MAPRRHLAPCSLLRAPNGELPFVAQVKKKIQQSNHSLHCPSLSWFCHTFPCASEHTLRGTSHSPWSWWQGGHSRPGERHHLRWGTPSNPRLTAHLSMLSAGNTRGEFPQLTLPKPESWSHGHRYLPRGAHLCFHLGDSLFRQGAGLHHRKSFCLQICKYFLAIQKRSKGALFIFSSP